MEENERWKELCALASKELDPEKLLKLIQEINAILQEKETRLLGGSNSKLNIK